MLKRLFRAILNVERFDLRALALTSRLDAVEEALRHQQDRERGLHEHVDALDQSVKREVLNMADLYGKTYRLLKRMQAEDRHDAATEEEPDIAPVADPVTERVMARRRHHVPARNDASER